MPFIGLGLHLLVALFFAVHAVRTRQQSYWLFILFSFPLLGSMAYFFSIYLPSNQRMQRQGRKLMAAAGQVLDPGRELREARQAWEYTPTAQNRMRLAAALLAAGQAEEAANEYAQCLSGPFANDADIRLGAAQAFALTGQPGRALEHLQFLQREQPGFRPEEVGILQAQTLAASGDVPAAYDLFEQLAQRHGGFHVHAEYAIVAAQQGDRARAERLRPLIEQATSQWQRAQRELNAGTMQRLNAAYRSLEQPPAQGQEH